MKRILLLTALLGLLALPAAAGHRHGRGCGHVFSRGHGGWVSLNVVTPYFSGSFSRAPRYRSRGYYDPYYAGGGYYQSKRARKAYKRHLKRQRRYRRDYHDHRYDRGYCRYR